jgi:spore coat polysaccharide biosynthesis protein SpsF
MGKKIVAIVQARMGANRLPGKMMLSLHGMPIVKWVYQRTQKAKSICAVVFAIPDNKDNDLLNEYLNQIGAMVYRGSEDDLVERLFMAAKYVNATHVVRVCADNPFISGAEVDKLIQFYLESKCDYAYNHIPKNNNYPNGIGAEIVSFKVLQKVNEEARDPDHREHVFNFIWTHPEKFKILTFEPEDKRLACPDIKLDIDTQQDFEKLCRMNVNIDMEAYEIVAAAKILQ